MGSEGALAVLTTGSLYQGQMKGVTLGLQSFLQWNRHLLAHRKEAEIPKVMSVTFYLSVTFQSVRQYIKK